MSLLKTLFDPWDAVLILPLCLCQLLCSHAAVRVDVKSDATVCNIICAQSKVWC